MDEKRKELRKDRPLTSSELKIWKYITENAGTTKTIGNHFNLSSKTVEVHLNNLRAKLGVHSMGELIILGWKTDLLESDNSTKLYNFFNLKEELKQLEAKIDEAIKANEENSCNTTKSI